MTRLTTSPRAVDPGALVQPHLHRLDSFDGESVPAKYVLGKPYRRADLAAKLREVLDEPAASG